MITKTVLITMLIVSSAVSPVHQNAASVPCEKIAYATESVTLNINTVDPSLIEYSPKLSSDFIIISPMPDKKPGIIPKDTPNVRRNMRVIIEGKKSYEECMKQSVELLCKNVNSTLCNIEKQEALTIEIIE